MFSNLWVRHRVKQNKNKQRNKQTNKKYEPFSMNINKDEANKQTTTQNLTMLWGAETEKPVAGMPPS